MLSTINTVLFVVSTIALVVPLRVERVGTGERTNCDGMLKHRLVDAVLVPMSKPR